MRGGRCKDHDNRILLHRTPINPQQQRSRPKSEAQQQGLKIVTGKASCSFKGSDDYSTQHAKCDRSAL